MSKLIEKTLKTLPVNEKFVENVLPFIQRTKILESEYSLLSNSIAFSPSLPLFAASDCASKMKPW